jgi:hypothetical protein
MFLKKTDRKITVPSGKHSITLYPSLSPYRWVDTQTDRETNTLAAHGLEDFFPQLCCRVSFLVVAGNSFWCCLSTSCGGK